MSPPVKYIATIHNVREVILLAAADLGYWEDRLRREHLFPHRVDGKAELMISAMASKWMGVPFRELCVTVAASLREDGSSRDGYFLAAAFNSSRFFSFCERTFFHTPYRHGRINVEAGPRCSFGLCDGGDFVFQAQMSGKPAKPTTSDELWEGKIFIPDGERQKQSRGNFFFAKLGGHTEVIPFTEMGDVLDLSPLKSHPVAQWLMDCRLQGKEWRVRRNATHARSKTYNRMQ
jgi:hypothetical protein